MLLNSFSNMILAIGCWICLITFCQSKVIEVNSEGNDSIDCCSEGKCACASLFEALHNTSSNTVINITSSISLHNVIEVRNLSRITIIGNGVTVTCNNSGNVAFIYCTNVCIQGITWDQCGYPNNLYLNYAVFFLATGNVSIRECTFQNSEVCYVVIFNQVSEAVVVENSRFLFNTVANSSLCEYVASLDISSKENPETVYFFINETLFYHNGALDYGESSILSCNLQSLQQVVIIMENLKVSTSLGLGGSLVCVSQYYIYIYLTNVTFLNNSNGGLNISMNSLQDNVTLGISSSVFANNINGALSILAGGHVSNVILYGTMITGNKGTFLRNINILFGNVEKVTGIIF